MTHIAVTLDIGNEKTHDLALPPDVPVKALLDGLSKALKVRHGQTLAVKTEQGLRRLPANASLGDSAVLHGMQLVLIADERPGPVTLEGLPQAVLQAEDGREYPLGSRVVIGRTHSSAGIFVDVDLSGYVKDPKIISRRHAQIEQEGPRYFLTDLGSVNGTRVNGQLLGRNERRLLEHGDLIEFGRNGARLTFSKRSS